MKKTLWARWFVAVLLVGGLAACSPREVKVGSWQLAGNTVATGNNGGERRGSVCD